MKKPTFSKRFIRVSASVLQSADGTEVLVSTRPADKSWPGYWEFPGGKIEFGETPEMALARELKEELDLDVQRSHPWLTFAYEYPESVVELHFLKVFGDEWKGVPRSMENQQSSFENPGDMNALNMLPANFHVARCLAMPKLLVSGEDLVDDFLEGSFGDVDDQVGAGSPLKNGDDGGKPFDSGNDGGNKPKKRLSKREFAIRVAEKVGGRIAMMDSRKDASQGFAQESSRLVPVIVDFKTFKKRVAPLFIAKSAIRNGDGGKREDFTPMVFTLGMPIPHPSSDSSEHARAIAKLRCKERKALAKLGKLDWAFVDSTGGSTQDCSKDSKNGKGKDRNKDKNSGDSLVQSMDYAMAALGHVYWLVRIESLKQDEEFTKILAGFEFEDLHRVAGAVSETEGFAKDFLDRCHPFGHMVNFHVILDEKTRMPSDIPAAGLDKDVETKASSPSNPGNSENPSRATQPSKSRGEALARNAGAIVAFQKIGAHGVVL